jgi:hypothetical protein
MRLTDGLRVGSSKAIRECHGDLFAAHEVIGAILTIFLNNLEKNGFSLCSCAQSLGDLRGRLRPAALPLGPQDNEGHHDSQRFPAGATI